MKTFAVKLIPTAEQHVKKGHPSRNSGCKLTYSR